MNILKNDNDMFFDKNGILDIDGMVADNDSFKAIMEDGIVTEDEVKAQSDKVIGILHDMETRYSEAQLQKSRLCWLNPGSSTPCIIITLFRTSTDKPCPHSAQKQSFTVRLRLSRR